MGGSLGLVIFRRRVDPVCTAASCHGAVAVDNFAEGAVKSHFDPREESLGGQRYLGGWVVEPHVGPRGALLCGDRHLGGRVRRWQIVGQGRLTPAHGCDGSTLGRRVLPRGRRRVAVDGKGRITRLARLAGRAVGTIDDARVRDVVDRLV